MEIGDHRVHHMKVRTRIQENICVTAVGLQWLIFARQLSSALQRSHGRGTDRDHSAASCPACRHGIAAGLIDFDVLAVHGVVFNMLRAHRLKRPRADVESHLGLGNAHRVELRQKCLIKMQPSGRRRHRTIPTAIQRLIAIAVIGRILPLDIGRQRHMTIAAHHVFEGVRLGLEHKQCALPAQHPECQIGDITLRVGGDQQQRAVARTLAGADVGQCAAITADPLNQDLYPSTRLLLGEQPRRDHPRVVKHQQIVGREQLREVPESQV